MKKPNRERQAKDHGITPLAIQLLKEANKFRCWCCERPLGPESAWSDVNARWHQVEHEHSESAERERIRGLTCPKCNTMIGMLGNTLPEIVESCRQIMAYLALAPLAMAVAAIGDAFAIRGGSRGSWEAWIEQRRQIRSRFLEAPIPLESESLLKFRAAMAGVAMSMICNAFGVEQVTP
jgi:hypothetical protein